MVATWAISARHTLPNSPQALRVRPLHNAPRFSRSACQSRAICSHVFCLMRRTRMSSRGIAARPGPQPRPGALAGSSWLAQAGSGHKKRAAQCGPCSFAASVGDYLLPFEASFAAFFLSSKLIFKTFLNAAMSRMSSPRSFISTRMASCSWASSWASPRARWPG